MFGITRALDNCIVLNQGGEYELNRQNKKESQKRFWKKTYEID